MKPCRHEVLSPSSGRIRRIAAKLPRQLFRGLLPVMAAGLLFMTPAQAAVTAVGDIAPETDPLTWVHGEDIYGADGTHAYIGATGYGELTVDGGSSISTWRGVIANSADASGILNVTGAGSTWTSYDINIGAGGTGALNITDGGVVAAVGAAFGSYTVVPDDFYSSDFHSYNGSNGSGVVDGAGSALNVRSSLYVGQNGDGSLAITNGGTVSTSRVRLGAIEGTNGVVTIDGAGSKLSAINIPTNNPPHEIGYKGDGTISITNGGAMETYGSFHMAMREGHSATVNVDGAGSSWIGTNVEYVPGIYGGGVSIGDTGDSTLNITNGGMVSNTASGVTIASNGDTNGIVHVDGAGSTWSVTTTDGMIVGRMGTAELNVTNGGQVVSRGGDIIVGRTSGAGGSGTILVAGAGSSFSHDGEVNLGPQPLTTGEGTGRLILTDGGKASVGSLNISSDSLVSMNVGGGSSLIVGADWDGTISNQGTIRLVADAATASGVYIPLTYGILSPDSTGTMQGLGGIVSVFGRRFTVSSAATAAAGETLTADLAETQRFLFTDGATGKSVGLSFAGTADSTELAVSASAMGDSALASLLALLDPDQAVLSGWDFEVSGYTDGDPVLLSLFAGPGQNQDDLALWHYDGSAWLQLVDSDLVCSGDFASFTATGFSGYAVTGASPVTPTPVPASVLLFGSGLAGLGVFRRRFSRG